MLTIRVEKSKIKKRRRRRRGRGRRGRGRGEERGARRTGAGGDERAAGVRADAADVVREAVEEVREDGLRVGARREEDELVPRHVFGRGLLWFVVDGALAEVCCGAGDIKDAAHGWY